MRIEGGGVVHKAKPFEIAGHILGYWSHPELCPYAEELVGEKLDAKEAVTTCLWCVSIPDEALEPCGEWSC